MADDDTILTDGENTVAGGEDTTPAGESTVADGEDTATGGEEKTAEEKKANGEDKEGAPEAYADFTMPEGMEVDKGALEAFAPVAKDLKLTQEQAQKLVDLQVKSVQEAAAAHGKAWGDIRTGWVDAVKADKDIGGDKLDGSVVNAKLAISKLGRTGKDDNGKDVNLFAQALEVTGMGDHPEVVFVLAKMGAIFADDSIDLGNVFGDGPKSHAEILYPNQGKT